MSPGVFLVGVLSARRVWWQIANLGEDHCIAQLQRQVMAPVVAQDGLEVEAGAAGDGRAARVALVAVNLDAVRAQRVEGKGGDGVDRLRDVALPGQ